ncbi:efflux RND transporter periplasmic adaptor subunit [Undibacterium sp. Ji50W]|uniref:efflux RND transporter periplasmic adaptor subunit n=1 Tax=Undibacterium sp. Ji50W TaxID=3413041 RepID=UPI003BF34A1D
MTNRNFFAPLLCALAVVSAIPVLAAERPARFAVTEQQMQALNIQVKPLQRDAAALTLSLPGQVTVPSHREQIVSSPLTGLVVQLYVQANQQVKQGTPLLRISSQELGPMQLQLMQAVSRTTLARQAAQREKALFDEGIIAQRRVQESQAAQAESEAVLRQAKAALRLAGLSTASIERIASSGKPEDGLTLHASRAGIVTQMEVKPGQRVDPSMALLHLAQTDRLLLEIQAPLADATAWRTGSKLQVQGRTATGHIVSISPMVVAGSQTVSLRAEVDGNSDLRPGELVTVQLPLAHSAGGDSFDVPLAAVAYDAAQALVFVRTADGFEARAVRVLSSAGQHVRIQSAQGAQAPLKADEKIAVSGVIALKGSWLGEKGGS